MNARDRTGAAALVGAAVTGLIAFALFLGGGLLLWANGHYKDADGYLTTGSQRFSTQEYAITTPRLDVDAGFLLKPDRYGSVRLEAMPKADKPLFVGVARTRDVDAYLRGVARSEVSDVNFSPFSARYTPHTGTGRPARPAAQDIWAAQGSHTLTWNVRGGDWSVVVMNADGSRGVAAAVSAGAKVPYIATIGYLTLGFGLLFIIATAALTAYGSRPVARRLAVV
jgi:hypothetical protein